MEEDESKITGKRGATDRGNKLGTLVLLSATLIRDISHISFFGNDFRALFNLSQVFR